MTRLKTLSLALLLAAAAALQGCAFVTGAAVGAAAGYVAKDQGYEVRSPVTKDDR